MNSRRMFALGGGLLLGAAGVVNAETAPSTAELQAQVAALQARLNQIEGQQQGNWLNERRAEEVKALVREVLNDADTRASLQEGGMSAGHNGKNFYLASEDGNFLMNISGQIQVRYIANFRDDSADADALSDDDNEMGFEVARAKVQFDGHIVNPNWLYTLRLAALDDDAGMYAEEVTIGYRITDEITARVGRSKSPFLREELTSSAYQLAVERSLVNEIFTAGYTEGLYLSWDAPYNDNMFRLAFSFDDGNYSGEKTGDFNPDAGFNDFYSDDADFAFGGRADIKVMGDWNQMKDFTSWSGEETGLFVGAALRYIRYEEGDDTGGVGPGPGDGSFNSQQFQWTVDASFESGGFNAFAALTGAHYDGENGTTEAGLDAYGLVLQAGYNINDKWEPFARYEYIDLDDLLDGDTDADDDINLLTFGVNYYIARHSAKATLDLIYAFDAIDDDVTIAPAGSHGGISALGLLADGEEDGQVAVRAQLQLLF